MKRLLFLLLLASQTQALYDSNLTVDAKGLQLCISADGFDQKTCSINQTLTVDGTRDHMLYIIPYQGLAKNATMIQGMNYYVMEGFALVALTLTAAFLFLVAWLFYNLYKNTMDYNGVFKSGK